MSKHTPGPWTAKYWHDDEHEIWGWNLTANGYLLPLCNVETDNDEECEANARLAAAAPAMLEALEALANEYGPHTGRMAVDAPRRAMWFNARAAIKAAKGEA